MARYRKLVNITLQFFCFADEIFILSPIDKAFDKLIPDLKPDVPNPLENDIPLMQHIVSNHLIITGGIIPPIIFERLEEYQEIIKVKIIIKKMF